MSSKAKKRKEQKRANRRKRLEKDRNQRSNRARFRYRLDVKTDGGDWTVAKRFRTMQEVQVHVDETEEIRRRGDVRILEGRVMDMNYTFGRKVLGIRSYNPKSKGLKDAVENLGNGSIKDAMEIEIPENYQK